MKRLTVKVGQKNEYFLSCQSAQGLQTFLQDALRLIKQVYIIKGGSTQTRSRIVRYIGLSLMDKGYDIDIVRGVINPDNLEGIIIPGLSLALICGEKYYELPFKSSDAKLNLINLDQFRDDEKYLIYKSKIKDIIEQVNVNLELVQEEIRKARLVYLDYCSQGLEMEERQVLYITEKLLKTLFTSEEGKMNHRFAQGITGCGIIDFYPKILEGIIKRHYLNGIKYLNSSGILKLIAREAVIRGLTVDVYHNCLDISIVELLILPEVKLAIGGKDFTGDFQRLINYKKIEKKIEPVNIKNINLSEAIKLLSEVDKLNEEISILFHEILDFAQIEKVEACLLSEIISKL